SHRARAAGNAAHANDPRVRRVSAARRQGKRARVALVRLRQPPAGALARQRSQRDPHRLRQRASSRARRVRAARTARAYRHSMKLRIWNVEFGMLSAMRWTRRTEIILTIGFPLVALLAYLLLYIVGL